MLDRLTVGHTSGVSDPVRLLLGPVLRWVDPHRATLWVRTDRPCEVEVTAGAGYGRAHTFTAFGNHYGLVVVKGLTPGTAVPYHVRLNGTRVWPRPADGFPASRIRTPGSGRPVRLLFGSCREANPYTRDASYPPDVLDSYAAQLARREVPWPDYLVLLGDQVYADQISPRTQRFPRRRRRDRPGPVRQVTDFVEYAALYQESWSDPELRWMLSTVPSMMIFDDHEVIDDWNISEAWRHKVRQFPWWQDRIIGALASYWIYQHLGNLSPDELATDPLFAAVHQVPDAAEMLTEYARAADAEADGRPGPRWSYRIDVGRTRIVMIDTRCSRVLKESRRDMLPPAEWRWFTEQLTGDYDHLVIGSSVPWLLPPAIHEVEATSEKLCGSPTRSVAAATEWLRQAGDLEHWAAFRSSFHRLGDLLVAAAEGRRTPRPPATVTVISGDVHHSYLARFERRGRPGAAIYQATCSPIRNQTSHAMKLGFHLGWNPAVRLAAVGLSRLAGRSGSAVRWRKLSGPYFQNAVALLTQHHRSARLSLYGAERTPDAGTRLVTLDQIPLSWPSQGRAG